MHIRTLSLDAAKGSSPRIYIIEMGRGWVRSNWHPEATSVEKPFYLQIKSARSGTGGVHFDLLPHGLQGRSPSTGSIHRMRH